MRASAPDVTARLIAPALSFFLLASAFAHAADTRASISGTLLPPGKAKSVQALERLGATMTAINNRYYPGTLDHQTGKFEIPNLPDGTYQLLIDCGDATIEGIDLAIDGEEDGPTFDYLFKTKTLTVQRLDLSQFLDPDEAPSQQKKDELASKALGLPKLLEKLDSLRRIDRFCDHFRPLCAHGTKNKALVLVELARLRDFYAGSGQAIYRIEIWNFERVDPVWDQPNKGLRVLQRHRLGKDAYLKLGAFLDPKLGGIKILKAKSVPDINCTIPDKWDDAMGKIPGQNVPRQPRPPEED